MDFYDFIKAGKEKTDKTTIEPCLLYHPLMKQQIYHSQIAYMSPFCVD